MADGCTPAILATGVMLTAVACQQTREAAEPSSTEVWLVDDGYHNALILPREALFFDPLLDHTGSAAQHPWIEVSLSERAWVLGIDRSSLRALRLLVDPGQAVITFQYHQSLEPALDSRRVQSWTWTKEELTRWNRFVKTWSDLEQPVERLDGSQPVYMVGSSYPYTLLRNCRAFTAESLHAASAPN